MDTLGRHIIADFWQCRTDILDDQERLKRVLIEAALEAGAEIKEVNFHKFEPQGISGVVVISESHLSLHSFPEHNYASVDVFTCGEEVDPRVAAKYIAEELQPEIADCILVHRGIGNLHAEKISLIENISLTK